MTAPFAKLANEKHDQKVLAEQQNQAIRMVNNSRRKETPAKKKASWIPEIAIAIIFVIVAAVAFHMVTAEHRGDPSFGGTPVSEMDISEQLKMAEEVRYNDN